MRFPFVRRSALAAAVKKAETWRAEYDNLAASHERQGKVNGEMWADHLARCNCHDSLDQCPCTEVGHKEPLTLFQAIHTCANKCCRWCG